MVLSNVLQDIQLVVCVVFAIKNVSTPKNFYNNENVKTFTKKLYPCGASGAEHAEHIFEQSNSAFLHDFEFFFLRQNPLWDQ